METILKKLKEQGWHLTENGVKKILTAIGVDENSADVRKIIATALDLDFRDIASGALPATNKREETLPGRIVLQITKVRNISAPKANEESKTSPRFLQLELTDGQHAILALELEHVSTLSLNLPPGTKIYFHPERLQLMQGYLVLRPQDLQVLGGRVEALVEKWELARTMQKYARSGQRMGGGATGPPPWIAFGKKLEVNTDTLPNDRNFKSLQAALEKEKDKQENQEFNAMRTEAIAEATKAGAKKVFGGGNQQIPDHNLKKILEKGYTEEEAKNALRATKNNLERALYNLKRRQESRYGDDASKSYSTPAVSSKPTRGGGVGGGRDFAGKRGAASVKEEAGAAKPAANVSLFDFLTDKLPANTESASTAATVATTTIQSNANSYNASKYEKPRSNYNNKTQDTAAAADSTRPRFENNISSSFANRQPGSTRGIGQRGGSNFEERSERSGTRSSNQTQNQQQYQQGGRSNRNSNERSTAPANSNTAVVNKRGPRDDRGAQREDRSGPKEDRGRQQENRSGQRDNRSGPREEKGSAREDKGFHRDDRSGSYDNRRGGGSKDYQQHGQNRNTGERERYGGNSRESKGYEKGRYNQRENSSKTYDNGRQQNSYNSNSSNNTNSSTTNTTANNTNNSSNPSNNNNSNINKLVEATSRMKIDKGREQSTRNQQHHYQQQQQQQQHQPHHRQQPQQQQQQQQPFSQQPIQPFTAPSPYNANTASSPLMQQQQQQVANFGQLPNGFTYDPSKIIGFQSKETNEFALSMLKSQGLPNAAAAANAMNSQQQQQQPSMPTQLQQHGSYVTASVNATTAPQPYGAPTYMMPSPVQASPAPPATFGDGWMWKSGDLCFAKYWDDGNFYEAEITAVSNKTCVVYFHGYGNHEEVLKTDCLPITDANNRPINNYNHQQQAPQMMVPQAQVQPPQAHRYRGERQMYVPPPKRDH